MNCERAQEFYSDYVEGTLSASVRAALQRHLAACAECRQAMEAFRATWEGLDAVPPVEPPPDLAWRVLHQLRQQRLERIAAARRRPPSWWERIAAWRPLPVAMATALATLLIVGLLGWPRYGVQWMGPPSPVEAPSATLTVELRVTPAQPLPAGGYQTHVEVSGSDGERARDGRVAIGSQSWSAFEGGVRRVAVVIPPTAARVAWFSVAVSAVEPRIDELYRVCLPLPGAGRVPVAAVSLPRGEYTLAQAAEVLASHVQRPVVVPERFADARAELFFVGVPVEDAVREIADRFGISAQQDEYSYRFQP